MQTKVEVEGSRRSRGCLLIGFLPVVGFPLLVTVPVRDWRSWGRAAGCEETVVSVNDMNETQKFNA